MKFGYTILYVKDVEKTVEFYELAFGLQRKFVHESGYGEMNTGATKLGFASVSLVHSNGVSFTEPQANAPAPPVEIALVANDIQMAYERATKAGAASVAPPKQKPWGQTVAYVRDLNGFLVELCTDIPE